MSSNKRKYIALACLYTSQLIPGHFAANAMPVIMRNEGFSLQSIGLIGIISMPWALKFLWSPIVDRYGRGKNHYRKWIFSMQIIFALITFAVSFLSLSNSFIAVLALMTFSYFFASTQDIAVDGYAVKALEPKERGIGNGIQAGCNMLGIVLGACIGLILYIKTSWQITLTTMFVITLLLAVPLLFTTEKESDTTVERASYADMLSFFRRKEIFSLLPVMFLAFAGVFSALMMIKPLLIDQGYSWSFISMAIGFYPLVGLPAALTAGYAVTKYGRRKVMLVSIVFQAIACSLLIPVSSGVGGGALIQAVLVMVFLSFSTLLTVFNTVAMDLARTGREGMDFTMFMSITFLGGTIVATGSGAVADRLGYQGLFAIAAVLCIVVFFMFIRLFRQGHISDQIEA